MSDNDYTIASAGHQPPTDALQGFTLTGTFDPPVELVVLGPGVVTWDGRMLQVTYAPGLTAEESAAGSARVKAMLEARKRT